MLHRKFCCAELVLIPKTTGSSESGNTCDCPRDTWRASPKKKLGEMQQTIKPNTE